MQEDTNADRHYALIDSLTSQGPDHLSDFELLTLLFGGCVPLSEAESCAHEYTREVGPPASLQSPDFLELTCIKGIGEVKAAGLIAGVELGRRSPMLARRGEALLPALDAGGKTGSPGILN